MLQKDPDHQSSTLMYLGCQAAIGYFNLNLILYLFIVNHSNFLNNNINDMIWY